jgi:RNA polymerase primary sigma factor
VLELRFGLDGDPQPLETIGKELGISRERVRQVEGEAMAELAKLLGDAADDDDELEQAA